MVRPPVSVGAVHDKETEWYVTLVLTSSDGGFGAAVTKNIKNL